MSALSSNKTLTPHWDPRSNFQVEARKGEGQFLLQLCHLPFHLLFHLPGPNSTQQVHLCFSKQLAQSQPPKCCASRPSQWPVHRLFQAWGGWAGAGLKDHLSVIDIALLTARGWGAPSLGLGPGPCQGLLLFLILDGFQVCQQAFKLLIFALFQGLQLGVCCLQSLFQGFQALSACRICLFQGWPLPLLLPGVGGCAWATLPPFAIGWPIHALFQDLIFSKTTTSWAFPSPLLKLWQLQSLVKKDSCELWVWSLWAL